MTLRLTDDEIKYVGVLASGWSIDEAAAAFGLTQPALNAKLRLMRAKTAANNTTHLVAMAVAEGLVKP
jgi:DNA-binding CsgD family transcriptional regulator